MESIKHKRNAKLPLNFMRNIKTKSKILKRVSFLILLLSSKFASSSNIAGKSKKIYGMPIIAFKSLVA